MLNVTLHRSTNRQHAMGVVDMCKEGRKFLREELIFKEAPSRKTMIERADKIVKYINNSLPNFRTVMLGGACFFTPILEKAFKDNGYIVCYSFSNYKWINIPKNSVTYKWYMQRYYKIYYKKAINYTKTWTNGIYNGLTKKNVKYTTNGSTKYVPGKSKDLSNYVLPSTDCESDNSVIKSLAKTLIKGKKSDIEKANSILKYVQNKVNYPKTAYGNTRYGAYGTLKPKVKIGNCVDSTHLTVALLRAANIPAKYEAKYVSKIKSGHCWPLVYLKVGNSYKWIGGEATADKFIAFGKHPATKKWQGYKADSGSYINSYKYSKKYVYDSKIKQWVAITEYQYINKKWVTYYVLNGVTDKVSENKPNINNLQKIDKEGMKV